MKLEVFIDRELIRSERRDGREARGNEEKGEREQREDREREKRENRGRHKSELRRHFEEDE